MAASAQTKSQDTTHAQGAVSTGGAHAAVLDAEKRPITAGGFVDSGPVIFRNVAEKAGLTLARDGVIKESPQGPYANIIAVRRADKDKPWAQQLVKAYQSPEVKSYIESQFKGALVPAF